MYIGMRVEVSVCVCVGTGCVGVNGCVCGYVFWYVKVCRCVVQVCTFVGVHVDVCGCVCEWV